MTDTDTSGLAPQMDMDELLALPVSVGIRAAGRAFGIGREAAYRMAAGGTFPCPVRRFGKQYRVTRPDLFRALGLDPAATAGHGEPEIRERPIPAAGTRSEVIIESLYAAIMAAARVLADRGMPS